MKQLTQQEIEAISGGIKDLSTLPLSIYEGARAAYSIGGKYSGSGGFIFGGLTQMLIAVAAPVVGGVTIGVQHLVTGREATQQYLNDLLDDVGPGKPGSTW